jgi:choline dehydrogenase-like flavoprotein
MAVAAGVLTDAQRRTLAGVCDTFVPRVEPDGTESEAVSGFLRRAPSDLGVPGQLEGLMAESMTAEELAGFAELLDRLAEHDFDEQPTETRTHILGQTAAASAEAAQAVTVLRRATMLFFYALPDEQGRNPNWDALGYPGPVSLAPSPDQAPKTIRVEELPPDVADHTLTADVCVVGSGAGGGVIAAELQRAGRSVAVLEMGPYRNESDFNQLELPALLEMHLGGGMLASEDGSVDLFAGSVLGGGTIVNWLNSLKTPRAVREEWVRHGLEGLDGGAFDEHLDAVWKRLGVNAEATDQNSSHQRLIAGLDARELSHIEITRNADPGCDDPDLCGYCWFGCQRGCKQSTMRTYLQDAADAGARFVVGCQADRVLVEDGRARGVEATVTDPDGTTARLTVEAPTVVVAGGSIESPALLLRSGIGGPAVGRHLRLHPSSLVTGVYDEPVEGWRGQVQSEVSHAFADLEGDHGFLVESCPVVPGVTAAISAWVDGETHKRDFQRRFRYMAPFISVQRDHGEGEVVIDREGQPVVRWSLSDETDRRIFRRATRELAELHRAAGASEIVTFFAEGLEWREGEDFDAFLEAIDHASYAPGVAYIGCAHQMGSCRMGSDPEEAVADGTGELHDTKGVWIGDGSAFPTAAGVNPMISIMALARRTAHEILASA